MATRLVLFWLFVAAGLLVGVQSSSAQHYDRIAIAGAYEGGPAFDLVVRWSSYSPRRRAGVTHFWGEIHLTLLRSTLLLTSHLSLISTESRFRVTPSQT